MSQVKLNENQVKELFSKAVEAQKNSYAIYSHYKVGASLLLKNGEYIQGANIENSSYPLSVCAERSALFQAYSKGYRKDDIVALGLVAGENNKFYPTPCGACRQVINDLMNKDCPIYMFKTDGSVRISTIEELLPYSFGKEDME